MVCKITSNRRENAQLRGEAIMYGNLKALQGHSIPRCFGYYSSGEKGCLVLEYCGETLDRAGKEFFVTPVSYKKQALGILEDIHRMKYLHNDFRDRNIALDEQGKIRLIDFGHAGSHGGTHGCHDLKDGKHLAVGIVQPDKDGSYGELNLAANDIGAWLPRCACLTPTRNSISMIPRESFKILVWIIYLGREYWRRLEQLCRSTRSLRGSFGRLTRCYLESHAGLVIAESTLQVIHKMTGNGRLRRVS
ncbi:hypothetical protein B0H21DRAFT_755237 [Amylocystis lapponica]|nr:hypothetical protein B0H21DRAFT_755237 [Amylocystis lapponica]